MISALSHFMSSSSKKWNLMRSPGARSFATFFVRVRHSLGASFSDTRAAAIGAPDSLSPRVRTAIAMVLF